VRSSSREVVTQPRLTEANTEIAMAQAAFVSHDRYRCP
ncbi:MAG: hypothetical protein ACI9SE_000778, partial [Neolewinella sp.]